jgi:hypothetical protein
VKEYKYLYQRMLDEQVIRKAYKNLRKGKTKRKEIRYIDEHLNDEVKKMYQMIKNTKPEGVSVPQPELAYKPRKRTPKMIHEHGKDRKIYMPEIHEQWLHHIIIVILAPIIISTAYKWSCGSFPKRGVHYGRKQMLKWIKDGSHIRNFAKLDIRHFYDSIRVEILMRELQIRIKDDWFLYLIKRCLKGFDKGIPLGFYLSQWLANYLLEPLDKYITDTLGIQYYMRYMDDIVMLHNSKKLLHKAVTAIKQFIGRRYRLKLKGNYQVCKFDYYKKDKSIGRPIDFMGFAFYRKNILIRKSIMIEATRMAKKIHKTKTEGRRYYTSHIRAMVSYMGWFDYSNTYDCYIKYIKPYVDVGKLKEIISKIDRRSNAKYRNNRNTKYNYQNTVGCYQ